MTNTTNNVELDSRADELEVIAAAVERTGTRLLGAFAQVAAKEAATPEELDEAERTLLAADRVATTVKLIIEAAGIVLERDDEQSAASVSTIPESHKPVMLDAWERAFLKIAANGETFSPATLRGDHTTFFGTLTGEDYVSFGERLGATQRQIIADLAARGIIASWHMSGRGLNGKYQLVIHSKRDPEQPVYIPPKRPNIPTHLPEALPQTTVAITSPSLPEATAEPKEKITPAEKPQPPLIDTTRRDARLAEEAARAAVVLSFARDGINNLEWPGDFDPEHPKEFNPWRRGQLAFELSKLYEPTRDEFIEAISTLIDQGVLYTVFFGGRTRVLNEPPSPELLDLINVQQTRREASKRKDNRAALWQESDREVARSVLNALQTTLQHVQQGIKVSTLFDQLGSSLGLKEAEFRQALRRLEAQKLIRIEQVAQTGGPLSTKIEVSKVFFFDQATKESWRTDPSIIMTRVVDLIDASRQS